MHVRIHTNSHWAYGARLTEKNGNYASEITEKLVSCDLNEKKFKSTIETLINKYV